ncbi:MAG: hypothetical protein ACE5G9_04990 [Nitrospinales bacterium]
MVKSPVISHLFILCAAALFFFIQGPELVCHPSNRLFDDGDSILNAWILAWDAHALSHSELAVWDAPIFFPAKNALAFSETMLGNLWLTLPIQYLTGNHILASNMLVLVSFILGTYFVFILVKDLTGNYWAGLFAGLVFSFNPYRWGHLPHLQLMPFFWTPLALFFAERFLNTLQARYFCGMLIVTWIQYYTSVYLGTMLLILLIAVFLVHIVSEREGKERWVYFSKPRLRRMFLIGLASSLLILLPLAVPYLKTALKWDFFRTLGENADYTVEPINFLFPNFVASNYQWLRELLTEHIHYDKGETAVFVGTLPLLFALSACFLGKQFKNHFTARQNKIIFRYGVVSIIMALIMMGPYLSVSGRNTGIPMPYQLVFNFVPGGSAMRVPARFVLPFLLSLSVLCGFAMAFILGRMKTRPAGKKAIVLALAGALLLADYKLIPWQGVSIEPQDKFPPVYHYLSQTNPGKPILELPVDHPSKFKYRHYQTLHWRPALGGYSGWTTPAFRSMTRRTQNCPDDECFRFLQITPAKTLVVHLEEYPGALKKQWESADLASYGFHAPEKFDADIVWERNEASSVPVSAKLKASGVYFADDRYGLIAIIYFEPAEEKKSWRFLTGNKSEIEFFTRNLKGEEVRIVKTLMIPPYVLPGEPINRFFTRLGKVTSDRIASVEIKSPLIESLAIDRSSMIFLSDENTSRRPPGELNAHLRIVGGFGAGGYYPDTVHLVKAEALNSGETFWLDPATNSRLHDAVFGNVFLNARWFDKSTGASCRQRQSRPVKEQRFPILRIVAPGERFDFERYITLPGKAGEYVLTLNMEVETGVQFDRAGKRAACFDITILPRTDSFLTGNLARFFDNPRTPEEIRDLKILRGLPRRKQERMLLEGAVSIRKHGGPASPFLSKSGVRWRKKTLEIADAIENNRVKKDTLP